MYSDHLQNWLGLLTIILKTYGKTPGASNWTSWCILTIFKWFRSCSVDLSAIITQWNDSNLGFSIVNLRKRWWNDKFLAWWCLRPENKIIYLNQMAVSLSRKSVYMFLYLKQVNRVLIFVPLWPQELGLVAMEMVFPSCSLYKLAERHLLHNKNFLNRIRDVAPKQIKSPHSLKWVFYSGSRSENLAMRIGWGHEEPDMDIMRTWERLWGVPLEGRGPSYTQHLLANKGPNMDPIGGIIALETQNAHPGHCRLRVYGDHTKVMEYMISFDRRYAPDIYRNRAECIVEKDGAHWISPGRVVQLLTDDPSGYRTEAPSSPAVMMKGGTTEIVPTLLCSHSLPFLEAYLMRTRYGNWPSQDTLAVMAKLPTLIVAAGHRLSANRETEWRISCSHLEYVLIRDLPVWVKQAYCALKYIMKSKDRRSSTTVVKNHTSLSSQEDMGSGGRTKLCSFHLKVTLLWELEKPAAWMHESPFYLMSRLFKALLKFIEEGSMPHYFMPECDLLQCVAPDELEATAHYIEEQIKPDPITAIILAPKYPRQLYGCVENKEGSVDEKNLIFGFCNILQAFTESPSNFDKSVAFLSDIFQRLDKYRYKKYHAGQNKQHSSEPLSSLVDMLNGIKKTGSFGPEEPIIVHKGFRIDSIQSEHQISAATTEVCGNCGLPNHHKESCHAGNNLTCGTCHKMGHKTWLCPNDQQAHNFPECRYVRYLFATSLSMKECWLTLGVYHFEFSSTTMYKNCTMKYTVNWFNGKLNDMHCEINDLYYKMIWMTSPICGCLMSPEMMSCWLQQLVIGSLS